MNMQTPCGEVAKRVKMLLCDALRSGSSSSICVEGGRDTGKSTCVDQAVREVGCDTFRWDDNNNSGTHSMHDAAIKSILSLVMPEGAGGRPPSEDDANRPVVLIADNVHDIFQENRTTVQLLLRKATSISGKRPPQRPTKSRKPPPISAGTGDAEQGSSLVNNRLSESASSTSASATPTITTRNRHRTGRPLHLIMTYDPEKLEARILSQLRAIASHPPLELHYPDLQETADYVVDFLLHTEPHAPEMRDGAAMIADKLRTDMPSVLGALSALSPPPYSLLRGHSLPPSVSVAAALSAGRKYLRGCSRELRGQRHAVDEEDGEKDIDDKTWDVKFRYTGFKIDSLANCLRQSPIRIDEKAGWERTACIADGLMLANILVGGLKRETYDDAIKNVACAVSETSTVCSSKGSVSPQKEI